MRIKKETILIFTLIGMFFTFNYYLKSKDNSMLEAYLVDKNNSNITYDFKISPSNGKYNLNELTYKSGGNISFTNKNISLEKDKKILVKDDTGKEWYVELSD